MSFRPFSGAQEAFMRESGWIVFPPYTSSTRTPWILQALQAMAFRAGWRAYGRRLGYGRGRR